MNIYEAYFKKLEEINLLAPEYFQKIQYFKTLEEIYSLKNHTDPFIKKETNIYSHTILETVFILKGPEHNNIISTFVDKGRAMPAYEKIPDSIKSNINNIINFKVILNNLKQYKADESQMLWLYLWGINNNVILDLKNKIHCTGMAFICNLKQKMDIKLKLLERHIFTKEQYNIIIKASENKWDSLYPKQIEEKQILNPLHPQPVNLDNLTPIPLIIDNSSKPEILKTTIVSQNQLSQSCTECASSTEHLTIYPSLHGHYQIFLCSTCQNEIKIRYAKTLDKIIQGSHDDELKILAKNPYLSEESIKYLAFHNNIEVRDELMKNPTISENIHAAIFLQNI
jgi:hypothetical protein